MSKKILNIASCDKFIPPFIDFVKDNFNFSHHQFLLTTGMAENNLKPNHNVFLSKNTISSRLKHYAQALVKMHQSDKIILHGLFDPFLIVMLFFMPWLLIKSYWIMWGGDLYSYQLDQRNWRWNFREFFRRSVIGKMGCFVTNIKGDYELAQKWYGATGEYCECIMYPSNLYKEYDIPESNHSGISIMVGNSADPTNNHIEVFERLKKDKDKDINIFVPLSYGNKDYANSVILKGKEIFRDNFFPMTDFMPFDKYLEFLGLIDIAIFNHKRQQAMGNTTTLLGLGKKVYMRSDITTWKFYTDIDVKVFDIEGINLELITKEYKQSNQIKVKEYFSEEKLSLQLNKLFNR